MFCTQCFKEIADISKYCPECGLYIVNNPLDKLEDEFDSKTKKYIKKSFSKSVLDFITNVYALELKDWLIIFSILIVAAGVIFSMVYFSVNN